jgi:hypothetical protein
MGTTSMKQFIGPTCQKIFTGVHNISHVSYIKGGGPEFNKADLLASGGVKGDLYDEYFYGPKIFRHQQLPNFDHYLPTSYNKEDDEEEHEETTSLPAVTNFESDTVDEILKLHHSVTKTYRVFAWVLTFIMRITTKYAKKNPAFVAHGSVSSHIKHLYTELSNGESPCVIMNQQSDQWTHIECLGTLIPVFEILIKISVV